VEVKETAPEKPGDSTPSGGAPPEEPGDLHEKLRADFWALKPADVSKIIRFPPKLPELLATA